MLYPLLPSMLAKNAPEYEFWNSEKFCYDSNPATLKAETIPSGFSCIPINTVISSAQRLHSMIANTPLAQDVPFSVFVIDEARTLQVQPAFSRSVTYCISGDFA